MLKFGLFNHFLKTVVLYLKHPVPLILFLCPKNTSFSVWSCQALFDLRFLSFILLFCNNYLFLWKQRWWSKPCFKKLSGKSKKDLAYVAILTKFCCAWECFSSSVFQCFSSSILTWKNFLIAHFGFTLNYNLSWSFQGHF